MTSANDVLAARTRLGISQAHLAELLSNGAHKLSARTVRSWELGEREPPPYLKYALSWIEQEHGRPRKPGPRPRRRGAKEEGA